MCASDISKDISSGYNEKVTDYDEKVTDYDMGIVFFKKTFIIKIDVFFILTNKNSICKDYYYKDVTNVLAHVAEKISSKWSGKGIIDNEEIDVYRYGIEIVLSSLFGMVSVLAIGLIFGALIQAIIFLAIFIPLRMYTGGYHAKTYIRCNTTTIILFATQVLLVDLVIFNVPIYFIGYLLGAIIIVGLAPIKNDNKKIETQHKKRYKAIASIIFAFDILCFILCFKFSYNKALYDSIYITLMEVIILMLIGTMKGAESNGKD